MDTERSFLHSCAEARYSDLSGAFCRRSPARQCVRARWPSRHRSRARQCRSLGPGSLLSRGILSLQGVELDHPSGIGRARESRLQGRRGLVSGDRVALGGSDRLPGGQRLLLGSLGVLVASPSNGRCRGSSGPGAAAVPSVRRFCPTPGGLRGDACLRRVPAGGRLRLSDVSNHGDRT